MIWFRAKHSVSPRMIKDRRTLWLADCSTVLEVSKGSPGSSWVTDTIGLVALEASVLATLFANCNHESASFA